MYNDAKTIQLTVEQCFTCDMCNVATGIQLRQYRRCIPSLHREFTICIK